MEKLTDFVTRRTNIVKQLNNQQVLYRQFEDSARYYAKRPAAVSASAKKAETASGKQK